MENVFFTPLMQITPFYAQRAEKTQHLKKLPSSKSIVFTTIVAHKLKDCQELSENRYFKIYDSPIQIATLIYRMLQITAKAHTARRDPEGR